MSTKMAQLHGGRLRHARWSRDAYRRIPSRLPRRRVAERAREVTHGSRLAGHLPHRSEAPAADGPCEPRHVGAGRLRDSFGNPRGQGEHVVGHNAIDIMGPIGLTIVSTTNGHVVRE